MGLLATFCELFLEPCASGAISQSETESPESAALGTRYSELETGPDGPMQVDRELVTETEPRSEFATTEDVR